MKSRPRCSFNEGEADAGGAATDPCWRSLGSILRGLLFLCILASPSVAQAAGILLVKPSGSDAAVLETFNRLRGELRVHGFQVQLVESGNGPQSGATDLSAMTELHGALAGVSLVRGSKPVSAEIFLLCLSREPEVRMRDIAELVGITERAVQRIVVADLEKAGHVERSRNDRRNRYVVRGDLPLRHRSSNTSASAPCSTSSRARAPGPLAS